MIFYHGTSRENWEKIQQEGVLWGRRFIKDKDGNPIEEVKSRCTYLAVDEDEAKCYGEIVLQVEYDPFIHPQENNYCDDCWQVRVYEPISIKNIRHMSYTKIPNEYRMGGQRIEVRMVDRCDDNCVGQCCLAGGFIEIADKFCKDDSQSDTSKENTFYHELTHSILRTMGETELNDNEKFVCCFSSFLAEAMRDAYFKIEE